MVLVINRMVLTAVILASISGSLAQESYLVTEEPLEATTCTPYTCKASKQIFTAETCIFYDTEAKTYYSNSGACGTTKTCTPSGALPSNYTCTAIPAQTATALIGEYCTATLGCLVTPSAFSTCTSNVCVGTSPTSCLDAAGTGREDRWCSAGQYCLVTTTAGTTKGVCTAQLQAGAKTCTANWDCVNNAYCDIAAGAATGICVELLSVKAGKVVQTCSIAPGANVGQNLLCESTLCATVDTGFKCLDSVKSDDSVPVKCKTPGGNDSACITKKDSITDKKIENVCTCGHNKNGDAYCALNPGDSHFQSYLKYTKKWLSSSGINKCNTEGRLDALCQQAQWDTKNIQAWTYYNLLVNYYPDVINAEDCVLENVAAAYKAAKDDYDSSAAFFTLSALVLAAFA